MLTFDERITAIEASLVKISNIINTSFNDGTIDTTNDELGAVLDQIFDNLRDIRERYRIIRDHLTMADQLIRPATRK
jgi:hypothetical protein